MTGSSCFTGGGFTPLENSFSLPRELRLSNPVIAALNGDGSFTIWNSRNGTKLMDLYIFKDLSWTALLSGGSFFASEGADRYISVYAGNTGKKLNKFDYRVK